MTLSIRREAAISFGINAVLSLAFFVVMFGLAGGRLSWGAPHGLAMDFVPQSIAVFLMSALVPALIVRKRLALPVSIPTIIARAVGCALAGALLGAGFAFLSLQAGLPAIEWGPALVLKLAYGGALGALTTKLILERMIR